MKARNKPRQIRMAVVSLMLRLFNNCVSFFALSFNRLILISNAWMKNDLHGNRPCIKWKMGHQN